VRICIGYRPLPPLSGIWNAETTHATDGALWAQTHGPLRALHRHSSTRRLAEALPASGLAAEHNACRRAAAWGGK
jgi:hypothetical protein